MKCPLQVVIVRGTPQALVRHVVRHGMTHRLLQVVAQAGMIVHLALVRQAGLAQALAILAQAGVIVLVHHQVQVIGKI